jgi:hypothetical protein
MTLRVVTPASGASQLTVSWDGGGTILAAGQVLDVPPGSALEAAIGPPNLTALTGTALAKAQAGSGGGVSN